MPASEPDLLLYRMLLVDWFAQVATEAGHQFSQFGTSGKTFTVGSPADFHVQAPFDDTPPYLKFVASDQTRQTEVDRLAQLAVIRVERREFGGPIWYSTDLQESGFTLSASFMGGFIERLGRQTRITGMRRLGRDVLLEFSEGATDSGQQLFAPRASVKVHVAAPGPKPGHFASHVAHSVVETVAAICTFALGRTVELPPTLFPSEEPIVAQVSARHTDSAIKTLARNHVSLDIFSQLGSPGGLEMFRRERAALLTFASAQSQEKDLIACILYVAAAECLTMPETPWRHAKLTKRFIEFFETLMPAALDTIVAHGNFEEVFGIRRGSRSPRSLRKDLLNGIYDYRSGLLHGGLVPSYRGLGAGFETGSSTRRALFADFAEGAILAYLKSPRSSLIGHPSFEAHEGDAA